MDKCLSTIKRHLAYYLSEDVAALAGHLLAVGSHRARQLDRSDEANLGVASLTTWTPGRYAAGRSGRPAGADRPARSSTPSNQLFGDTGLGVTRNAPNPKLGFEAPKGSRLAT